MGGGHNLFRDFNGFIRGEIHRDLDPAFRFDEQPDHALIGWPDLQVGFNVAFCVDAHEVSPKLCQVPYPAALEMASFAILTCDRTNRSLRRICACIPFS